MDKDTLHIRPSRNIFFQRGAPFARGRAVLLSALKRGVMRMIYPFRTIFMISSDNS